MDARILRLISCALVALGAWTAWLPVAAEAASYRTRFFVVSAPTAELAKQVGDAAERYRKELALDWLGNELPDWRDVCPIYVTPQGGAGGETRFTFIHGQPCDWRMIIQGSPERILDSVLPHEVLHMVFATHFRQGLPRWADEGACTTVEHESEKSKQDRLLYQCLTTDRGIAFNKMFAMREYPQDMLPLYAQGFSLARFLISVGGKRKYVDYIGEGLKTNQWTVATRRHYGFESLSQLQVQWLEWVRQGGREELAAQFFVNRGAEVAANERAIVPAADAAADRDEPVAERRALPAVPPTTQIAAASSTGVSTNSDVGSGGWYEQQRDAFRNNRSNSAPRRDLAVSRPQPVEQARERVIELSSPAGGSIVPPQPSQTAINTIAPPSALAPAAASEPVAAPAARHSATTLAPVPKFGFLPGSTGRVIR